VGVTVDVLVIVGVTVGVSVIVGVGVTVGVSVIVGVIVGVGVGGEQESVPVTIPDELTTNIVLPVVGAK
jgi:hypothetical protein